MIFQIFAWYRNKSNMGIWEHNGNTVDLILVYFSEIRWDVIGGTDTHYQEYDMGGSNRWD